MQEEGGRRRSETPRGLQATASVIAYPQSYPYPDCRTGTPVSSAAEGSASYAVYRRLIWFRIRRNVGHWCAPVSRSSKFQHRLALDQIKRPLT